MSEMFIPPRCERHPDKPIPVVCSNCGQPDHCQRCCADRTFAELLFRNDLGTARGLP